MNFFLNSKDIGIDLGTSNTLLYIKGKGISLLEPSVVAVNAKNNQILAVGSDAKKMIGRTPGNIVTISPLKDGVIANLDITQQMLKKFIGKVFSKGSFKSSNIIICHPTGITEVEKRVLNDATSYAGKGKVILIEQPVAAAIGAGLPVSEPIGSMIVDIGGGTTEVSVISLGGIVTSQSLRVAGDELDDAIINYVKKQFNLFIGQITAEKIKIELGSVFAEEKDELKEMQISGRDLISGLPRAVTITNKEIREILQEPVSFVIDAIKSTIEQTAPELAADIMDNGIMLSGGGALLKGLDKLIHSELHIPVHIAEHPIESVVIGAGKCLDTMNKIKETKTPLNLL
ncbi:rod shape-determining protein [Clostridium sp. CX1]|uniref:Cell shape-determining protein MreB n=1 Tax=Clostridium tanneri TaxID=3037988 RepID=A0ABU4JTU3_9CLOT|nr:MULTISPECIES: rod shape-determining protein [unclassified Clostridium]MCT8975615.1 rod shape-determining protein [Clostridium sp. CX1]MDW8801579.1 rod shape-determining protein [Clostridium sp. A1-XYC3]